jgi:tRNA (mo5U34)-methyltransferase
MKNIAREVERLGPWFHNLDLAGVQTAPRHFLGDYPRSKFLRFEASIPRDLRGKTVLDIGCNAGFYSLEMKRRGAERVVAIDSDETYLAQAKLAAEVQRVEIELRRMDVYEVEHLGERFDVVLFLGVLYHLRHPLLALDRIRAHVAKGTMIFQCLQRGSAEVLPVASDYAFEEESVFDAPGYPKMHFVEHRYAHDETNWWIPNRACVEAMLRSAGFSFTRTPERDVYLCEVSR